MKKRQASISTEVPSLLLTVQQAAEAMGVGKDLVYALIKQGSLPALNLARPGQRQKLRIPLAVMEQWIMEQTQQQNPHNDLIKSRQADVPKTDPPQRARKGRAQSGRDNRPTASKQKHSRAS